MKIVVVGYGSRGDVEPCAAVARELMRRGHDVRMAVAPDNLALVEAAGLDAVAYGPEKSEQVKAFADFVANAPNPLSALPEVMWSTTASLVRGVSAAAMLVTIASGSGRGNGTEASTVRAPTRSHR